MNRVFVNALSIGAFSGRHVLYGHLRRLAAWTRNTHEFVGVHVDSETPPDDLRGDNIRWSVAPKAANHWLTRSAWEVIELPRWIRREKCSAYLSCSGTILPRSSVPQWSIAPNPWCLVPGMATGLTSRIKARLQRAAYRTAFRSADCMVYISEHLRDLYRRNAGNVSESRSMIGYLGINDDAWAAAARAFDSAAPHDPHTVLCISAMAPWKGAETLVSAIAVLRKKGVPARLRLVGPWPDVRYEALVRNRIESERVQSAVDVVGRVSVEQLHHEYASAAVYSLMSKCESFGIPALEGEAFGVPVVGSSVCAMPEICGAGGVYGQPDDPESTATLLFPFLTNATYREKMSHLARQNASRFHWDDCSRPLLDLLVPGGSNLSQPVSLPVSSAV